ncbi:MAG TPA: hemolysin III family protein [Acidimicrobiales bacterium]|jgi:hemolysin III|nr:hemolysin III family protein [Acidimicrobiales bacterium]
MDTQTLARPSMRGVLHRYAAVALPVATIALAAAAPDAAAAGWVLAFGLSVTAMLATSATYHARSRSDRARRILQRLDHSMILVAIAGSYTGIVGLALDGSGRTVLIAVVWVLAAIGVGLRMLWLHAKYWVAAVVYVGIGWVALADLDGLARATTTAQLSLIVAGGVLYTVGAIVFALHRPNPWPATFGYHELFHALVVAAAATHLGAVILLLQSRP